MAQKLQNFDISISKNASLFVLEFQIKVASFELKFLLKAEQVQPAN